MKPLSCKNESSIKNEEISPNMDTLYYAFSNNPPTLAKSPLKIDQSQEVCLYKRWLGSSTFLLLCPSRK